MRPQPLALAYNLANFLRTLALPDAVARWWSVTTPRDERIKLGGRLAPAPGVLYDSPARLNRRAVAPFAAILRRIDRLRASACADGVTVGGVADASNLGRTMHGASMTSSQPARDRPRTGWFGTRRRVSVIGRRLGLAGERPNDGRRGSGARHRGDRGSSLEPNNGIGGRVPPR